MPRKWKGYKKLPWKSWRNAQLWDVALYFPTAPLCGQRYMMVKRGRKYVSLCCPVQHIKFRITRSQWDGIAMKHLGQ